MISVNNTTAFWFLCAVLIAVIAACSPESESNENTLIPLGILDEAAYIAYPHRITLDGNLDDWEGIPRHTVTDGLFLPEDAGDNDRMQFAIASDGGNIFALMTTPDKDIINDAGLQSWERDSFEIYLNLSGQLQTEDYIDGVMQIRVPAGNLEAEDAEAAAVDGLNVPTNTEAITFRTGDGWGAELRIPLYNRVPIAHGHTIGLQVYANGANQWGRSAHMIWARNDTEGTAYEDPSRFGQGIFYEIGASEQPQPVHFSVAGAQPRSWGELVSNTYLAYRQNYIFCGANCANNLGLVFDPSSGYAAVSEGVGYGMLMAVMMDDPYTFDVIYDAAHDVMLDEDNNLFHWRADSSGTITDVYAATDADLDVAIALIFAQRRVERGQWPQHPERPYGERARSLLDASYTTHIAAGQYLTPGTLPGFDGINLTNLSYFAPAWYRIFDAFEGGQRWGPIIDQGYETLYATPGAPLGLAPDWSSVNGLSALDHCRASNINLDNCRYDMGYDAIRVAWRVGLDCLWYDEPRACEFSQRSVAFLAEQPEQRFARMYDLDGETIVNYRDEAMIAMWYFAAAAAQDGPMRARLSNLLIGLGDPINNGHWNLTPDQYYNQSLAWFAASHISGDFRNLFVES